MVRTAAGQAARRWAAWARRSWKPCRRHELAAFQARRAADPAFRALVGGALAPVALSGRATYCLLSAGGTVTPYSPAVGQLLQGDWCDPTSPIGGISDGGESSQAVLLRSITDSGQFLVYPVTAQGVSTVFIEAAFYRPRRGPDERRAAPCGGRGMGWQLVRDRRSDQRSPRRSPRAQRGAVSQQPGPARATDRPRRRAGSGGRPHTRSHDPDRRHVEGGRARLGDRERTVRRSAGAGRCSSWGRSSACCCSRWCWC